MKKIVIVLLLIILCVLGIEIIKKLNVDVLDNTSSYFEERVLYTPFEKVDIWNAKSIWLPNDDEFANNEWMLFRKSFTIDDLTSDKVIANIACDSKYWLYINDELVVREGNLKRGEKPNSTYYDQLDVKSYLINGENTISIMVLYYGRIGFSHISSSSGMLKFQMDLNDKQIISDSTWKASKNPCFIDTDNTNKNWRLSESNYTYDASKEIDWYKKDYDDSSWQNAYEFDKDVWGELIQTNMPLFVYDKKLTSYSNSKDYQNVKLDKDTVLKMKTKVNHQALPYLKVEANQGDIIKISTSDKFEEKDTAMTVTYIAKDGVQEFEMPTWINGDYIYYQIPKGVKIINLAYRKTGYDVKQTGSFESDDKFLNDLWTMAKDTLYVNMRDSYMDCPDRERAQWLGDASIEMEEAMYAFDTNSYYLYEKCIKTLLGWKNGNIMHTVSPSYQSPLQLPIQNYIGIISMEDYYEYTGNKEFLELVYTDALNYLNIWNVSSDGLIQDTKESKKDLWEWYDSSSEDPNANTEVCDEDPLKNFWYYYALNKVYDMSVVLEKQNDQVQLKAKIDKMYAGLNKKYWDGRGYKSNSSNFYDLRVNSVAVLSNLASEDKYELISDILTNKSKNSCFMEKYILEALSICGDMEEVQERIKTNYSTMVSSKDKYSTLWEYWIAENGTTNHAWSGGPMIIMSKYMAGISPLKPGYEEISIKPNLGSLNNIKCEVDTIKGLIKLNVSKNKTGYNLNINVPSTSEIEIEKISDDMNVIINKTEVVKNGKFIDNNVCNFVKEDAKNIYIKVDPESYDISVKM